VRIATWNVNSLKARLPRVESWLAEVQPDVLCVQETKLADDAFPALSLAALGYDAVHHGQGRWNGVAILSRVGLEDVRHGFAGPPPAGGSAGEARLLTARCAGVVVVTVYVPNGRAVGHAQYHDKLAWLEGLVDHLDAVAAPGDEVVVCGDFNVAPEDRDVWDPAACHGGTHVSPAEREVYERILAWGLTDVLRVQFDDAGIFSWWDYRAGAFHRHLGMRIDLVLATAPLVRRLEWVLIDRNARKGQAPSDHAPVVAGFAGPAPAP
jgi:exodeoxyribonuclease III